MQYDLLIKNGYVVDYASAREGYFDVAVQNGMIAAVETVSAAAPCRSWMRPASWYCLAWSIRMYMLRPGGRQLRPHDAGQGWCDQCFGYVGAGDQCTGAGA